MMDWPGSEEKMTSDSSLKLRFSKSYWDVVRDLHFQFGVI